MKSINCLNCGKETTNKKFCSNSCSNKFNAKRGVIKEECREIRLCTLCNNKFKVSKRHMRNFCSTHKIPSVFIKDENGQIRKKFRAKDMKNAAKRYIDHRGYD